jgi:hypothetical protein
MSSSSNPRRRALIGLLATGSLFAMVGCMCSTTPVGGPGELVTVLGDSISVQSTDAIDATLTPDHQVLIGAIVGFTWASMRDEGARQASYGPAVAVFNLGTNDLTSETPDQVLADEALTLAEYPASTCKVIVTVDYTGIDGFVPATPAFNQALTAPADEVVDWASATAADPSLVKPVDHVHPTDAGKAVLSSMIRDAVLRCDTDHPATTTTTADPSTTDTADPSTTTTVEDPTTTTADESTTTTVEDPTTTTDEDPTTTTDEDPTTTTTTVDDPTTTTVDEPPVG